MNMLQDRFDRFCKTVSGKQKINYENLKNKLGYEDWFYESVINKISKENNIKIRFHKEFLLLEKIGGTDDRNSN